MYIYIYICFLIYIYICILMCMYIYVCDKLHMVYIYACICMSVYSSGEFESEIPFFLRHQTEKS